MGSLELHFENAEFEFPPSFGAALTQMPNKLLKKAAGKLEILLIIPEFPIVKDVPSCSLGLKTPDKSHTCGGIIIVVIVYEVWTDG